MQDDKDIEFEELVKEKRHNDLIEAINRLNSAIKESGSAVDISPINKKLINIEQALKEKQSEYISGEMDAIKTMVGSLLSKISIEKEEKEDDCTWELVVTERTQLGLINKATITKLK